MRSDIPDTNHSQSDCQSIPSDNAHAEAQISLEDFKRDAAEDDATPWESIDITGMVSERLNDELPSDLSTLEAPANLKQSLLQKFKLN